jgi:hypothetical protein
MRATDDSQEETVVSTELNFQTTLQLLLFECDADERGKRSLPKSIEKNSRKVLTSPPFTNPWKQGIIILASKLPTIHALHNEAHNHIRRITNDLPQRPPYHR